MKDILIEKKAGDDTIIVVSPQTDKAKKHFAYISLPVPFEVMATESTKILAFAVSHNFSVDSKVKFIIQAKK